VAQRIALGLLLLLAVSVLIFAGTQVLPGDVAQAILGQSATPQALENLRTELGLNDPAYMRYLRWLGGVLTGDLGTALGVLAEAGLVRKRPDEPRWHLTAEGAQIARLLWERPEPTPPWSQALLVWPRAEVSHA
jgi:hypothetical protein